MTSPGLLTNVDIVYRKHQAQLPFPGCLQLPYRNLPLRLSLFLVLYVMNAPNLQFTLHQSDHSPDSPRYFVSVPFFLGVCQFFIPIQSPSGFPDLCRIWHKTFIFATFILYDNKFNLQDNLQQAHQKRKQNKSKTLLNRKKINLVLTSLIFNVYENVICHTFRKTL